MKLAAIAMALAAITISSAASAAPDDPVKLDPNLTLDPILDGRLRYEGVDTSTTDADALTLRLRAGAELRHSSGLSVLAEAEGVLALANTYNAFAFPVSSRQRRTGYAVVADPMNVELNRAQVQYKSKLLTLTLGRQRINLDDQRFVGSVGWRQNEQTFDAVRAEAKAGPVNVDGVYATSQRTIFGIDAGPRQSFDGSFIFLGAGTNVGPVQVKGFAYLLDYDLKEQGGSLALPNADTQTYGVRATGNFSLTKTARLSLAASTAWQSDWRDNPLDYSATYLAAEGTVSDKRLAAMAGYERLGGNGIRAFQTPMATLHKFNGWADLFLVTPASGLEDIYGGAAVKFPGVKAISGLNLAMTWHRFEAAQGGQHFGNEWDASVGFKRGAMNVLAKFADYRANSFGADTRKAWLQVELAY